MKGSRPRFVGSSTALSRTYRREWTEGTLPAAGPPKTD